MASETNELTFVRCPTCRSLVPASASKCRICNAALDAGAKSGAPDAPPPVGRVRQKTVSAGADEVRNMVAAGAPPAPRPQPVSPGVVSPQPSGATSGEASKTGVDDDAFDPLGAFLQDLDSTGAENSQQHSSAAIPDSNPQSDRFADDEGEDDNDDFDLDIFDDPSFEDLDEEDADEENLGGPVHESAPFEADEVGGLVDEDDDSDAEPVPTQIEPETRSVQARPAVGDAQREQVTRATEPPPVHSRNPEPPPRRDPRSSTMASDNRDRQGSIEPKIGGMPKRPEAVSARKSPQSAEIAQPKPSRSAELREPQRTSEDIRIRPESRVPAAKPRIGSFSRPDSSSQRAQQPSVAETPTARDATEGSRAQKMKSGRLFGWLVSYEHPDGRAIELRSGRFFITGTSIRGTDLILEDQSISTPHALMAITDNGLQIQDLMSERGTFVRTQGEAQYTREDGVVQIRHGDWVRFGDVEFLVTLVPS